MSESGDDNGYTRRDILSLSRTLLVLGATPAAALANEPAQEDARPMRRIETSRVRLRVNGKAHELELDNRTSLLDALREHLHLTGSKKGCDHGQCGACTLIVDGRRINGCLTLAVMHQDAEITTIEGLGTPEQLHPMQAAFVRHDGYQCGYCTPGQICSAVAVLDEVQRGIPSHVSDDLEGAPQLSDAELRERMSGNICRCGAYSNIIEAINDVAGKRA
ncbi:aldehyde dehydrogenase iron-sulfur subunit PaoA [Pseudomonas subflava]|uniref:aldehyde dehydrogenase iron-sulfur subunit PaoA n=1 Tax=Pseudomonas subflava TaxID=2952933 RepID=UPI002079FB44|nr:aldehyde dehydrogenase iron-sulfur subunit PaoA [Pseudomonas subflava]